jgi:hypothetical protein
MTKIAYALACLFAVACTNSPSPVSSADAGADVAALPSGHLGGEAGPPEDSASSVQTQLRIAHLSPDLPSIDVCVAPHGTTSFVGPLIGPLSGLDAGAPGLTYAQVSAYLSLDPGQYDVRLVPAGSTSCAAGVGQGFVSDAGSFPNLPDVTNLRALAPNASATLLLAGLVSPSGDDARFAATVVVDDVALAGAAELRAINAVPRAGTLDFGLGSSAGRFTSLVTGVAFAAASAQAGPTNGAVNSNGYVPIPSLSGQTLSACAPSAASDLAVANAIDIPFGSIATVIAVGGGTNDAAHPPSLIVCIDNQPSGGTLSDCTLPAVTP